MKEFKGTKGEWKLVHERQVAFSQEDFSTKDCDLYEHQYDSFDEMRANAKLIAAAPELLKALLEIEKILKTEWPDTEWYDFADKETSFTKAINKALN